MTAGAPRNAIQCGNGNGGQGHCGGAHQMNSRSWGLKSPAGYNRAPSLNAEGTMQMPSAHGRKAFLDLYISKNKKRPPVREPGLSRLLAFAFWIGGKPGRCRVPKVKKPQSGV